MNPTERFYFDARTQEILEHLTIPFAIYQYCYCQARMAQNCYVMMSMQEIIQRTTQG